VSGLKVTAQRKAILAAAKKASPSGDYWWDGEEENDRPLTREEMQSGVEDYRKKRSRPISATRQAQVSVRYSPEVLLITRSSGQLLNLAFKRGVSYGDIRSVLYATSESGPP
jgi:hypothetical protein